MRRVVLVFAFAFVSSCYQPSFSDCNIMCGGQDQSCPQGEHCSNGWCTHARQCACTAGSCTAGGQVCNTTTMSCVDFLDCTTSCTTDRDCGSDGVCDSGKCTHATGGASCGCMSPPAFDFDRGDVYVGSDPAAIAGSGAFCPYATISAAVKGVSGAPKPVTIHVSAGTYDAAHGETFPIVVRGAMSIVGAGAANTIVSGAGNIDHSVDQGVFDNSAISDWPTFGATFQVGDVSADISLAAMTITRVQEPNTLNVFFGLFCDRGNTPSSGSTVIAPNTSLNALAIGPGYHTGVVVANSATSGCNLALTGSTINGNGRGAWVLGCGLWGISDAPAVAAVIGDGTSSGANTFSNIYGSAYDTQDSGYCLDMFDCTQSLIVRGNTFSNAGMGIVATNGQTPFAAVVIDDNTFESLETSGASFSQSVHIDELSGNTFTNAAGFAVTAQGYASIDAEPAALVLHDNVSVLKARNNQFLGNNSGVFIDGDALAAGGRTIDFGTAGDSGNNVFRCNSGIENPYGFDLWVQLAGGSDALPFAGNQWDHSPPTTGNSAGSSDGTDVVDTSATPLPQIVTAPSALAAIACPPGKTTAYHGPLK